MLVDYFIDCHYPAIATLLLVEHALVFMAAIGAFVSAYKTSRLRPSIRRSRRRNSISLLSLPEL